MPPDTTLNSSSAAVLCSWIHCRVSKDTSFFPSLWMSTTCPPTRPSAPTHLPQRAITSKICNQKSCVKCPSTRRIVGRLSSAPGRMKGYKFLDTARRQTCTNKKTHFLGHSLPSYMRRAEQTFSSTEQTRLNSHSERSVCCTRTRDPVGGIQMIALDTSR